ncbi:MAG TPA: ABC transporter permease [Cyclobacteriaceae bacterium]|nr:ABC transporter permease [Cyclobacteriaceae bacterium]
MIRNYLLVIYRNLTRQFSYSFINIVGLAVGLSCSLVIFLYVYGEWNYDRGFAQADRIYRVGISFFNMGRFANGPEELLNVLPKEFAGIETATRISKDRDVTVKVNDKTFIEPVVYYTDTAFFHVFHFSFLAGDVRNVLKGPHEVVLTVKTAEKLFGKSDVLGEVLEIGKERTPYAITGVVEDPGFPTHLNAAMWISNQSMIKGERAWSSAAFYNYVLLKAGSTEADLNQALEKTIEKHVYPESGVPAGFKSLRDYKANENSVKFYVHHLQDIYLKSKLSLELSPGGNEMNSYIFSAISLFILVLAAVNFVNLTTARASGRAKEVGIRKTLGTSRGRLIVRFLVESVFTCTVAMVLALFLSEVFLVVFEYIAGNSLVSTVWTSPSSILLYFGFAFLVGILSGIYPAFYLTSFTPVKVLKGNVITSGGSGFRNVLVVFQFSVSITLIICTAIVLQQMRFIQTKDLGFDQQNVVTVDNGSLLGHSAESFKDELTKEAGVIQSSFHGGEPGSKRILSFYTYQTAAMEKAITINTYWGDADYVSLMGYRLLKGRTFSKDLASDTSGIILNETAVRVLGLGDQPVGAVVNKTQRVIGVVSDFHWESLRNSIAPTAIILSKEKWQIGFRLNHSIPGFLKKAEARWNELVPDEPFRYHFVDENFGELLQKEKVFGKAITFFTFLAIFISCLGLYGLAAYTAEQRTKEIGIRKVLGATAANIVLLLNKNFTRLVLLSIVIAIPAAIFIVSLWLEGFAYRTPVEIWAFAASILTAMIIAWTTVSYHSLKAALINPAETIKYE